MTPSEQSITGTATFVRRLQEWRSEAHLYRLDPPAPYGWGDEPRPTTDHVIVSAVFAPFSGEETYIFPATAAGEAIEMGEMDGSFRGGLDHKRALQEAGYKIAESGS